MKKYQLALAAAIAEHVGVAAQDLLPSFGVPPKAEQGDISFGAFAIARAAKKDPRAVAAELAQKSFAPRWVERCTAAGPYVNFFLDRGEFAQDVLRDVAAAGSDFGKGRNGAGRTIVVDYSSPNIAKQLAVHHLRSTMIGNALVHLHRALGYQVVGVNHLGDWGTSFGKLLTAWARFGGSLEQKPLAEHPQPIELLNDLYVRFHEKAKADSTLEDEARRWFHRLEQGDTVARDRWKQIRDASWQHFERIYRRLGVSFEEVIGESFFEDRMPAVIAELERLELLEESDEAQVVALPGTELPPALIRKKDGATLYATRDLAAAEYRWERWHFDKCLYVVDAGQALHFRQLFGVLRRMGKPYVDRLQHVDFGILRLPVDGSWVRGKTREGQVVLLEHVLDRARDLAREKILEKNPELKEIDEAAEAVGMAAVIFADLKARRTRDVNFDLEQITSFEGETGAYLQYTHVRFCGILRNYSGATSAASQGRHLATPEETALLKEIASFPAAIERAAVEAEPSILSQYLLGVASLFNNFYAAHRVLAEDPAVAADRVTLVRALRTVVANGLAILGIRPLERM
ncbi:MAG: arginine--tRNA ligase [Planctomycetes bacterium]|nr:arginine--tRNA ligase [Planctomycetota bacterium]